MSELDLDKESDIVSGDGIVTGTYGAHHVGRRVDRPARDEEQMLVRALDGQKEHIDGQEDEEHVTMRIGSLWARNSTQHTRGSILPAYSL